MGVSPLKELARLKAEYGRGAAERKTGLINRLDRLSIGTRALCRYHDLLCWMRAYPDNSRLLDTVGRALDRFADRSDLKRHRKQLFNTGIAGTATFYQFYWPTARWLADNWPERLSIDWAEWEHGDRLEEILPLLLPYSESIALDHADLSLRQLLDRLKGEEETDATFLIRRFEKMKVDSFTRETMFDALDIPMRLSPGPGTPVKGLEYHQPASIVFQNSPLDRTRPDLRREANRPPLAIRDVPTWEGRQLVDLARAAMVNRARDLDAFANADPRGVRMVDCGAGLQIACYCAQAERRLMLESSYGYMTIRNGVPTGYGTISALFGSAEIAYNIFDAFRGGEAARILGRILATARTLFGAETFSLEPYQLGHENSEGLKSGAWWFYQKLGFRPDDDAITKLMNSELRLMKKDRSHRSDLKTLKQLVSGHLYLHLNRPRDDVLGKIDLGNIGLAVSRYLSERFGSARDRGLKRCATEAAGLFGVGSRRGFSDQERLMWERWSPLLLSLNGVERWSAKEKSDAVQVVRAKGGRHESKFVRMFDRHRKLRRAVTRLSS